MNDDMPWVNLTQEEVNELRNKKYELTEYGKQKLKELKEKQKMTEKAQKVIDAAHRVVDGGVPLGKLIREGKKDPMSARVNYEYAAVLREVVEQYRVGGLVYCEDILELADELETL
jgi:hypothetical protein